ncbi:MAG: hypothetical protein ACJ71O_12740 [Nitrososphaeraceae archaeon]
MHIDTYLKLCNGIFSFFSLSNVSSRRDYYVRYSSTMSIVGYTLFRSYGKDKAACCIGSADGSKNASKPICEQCGLGCYSVLLANGIKRY